MATMVPDAEQTLGTTAVAGVGPPGAASETVNATFLLTNTDHKKSVRGLFA